ncbi:hypothetical protein G5I_11918 [Acromyrmex echinatior]|uniref:Uncharacterized protein n=1 Tax=Acromyrmex echinatior TaxID=103372 RepID=F4X0X3_ACREC|nr:hypothetical protein G5I_11918 [Acromyrmex echinatior]
MAKSVDDTFNLILLYELVGLSVVLAISLYYVIMNLDMAKIATCCTFTFFALISLVMLFGYCLTGDELTQQVLLEGTISNRLLKLPWRICRCYVELCYEEWENLPTVHNAI